MMQNKKIAKIKCLYTLKIIVILVCYSFEIKMLEGNL